MSKGPARSGRTLSDFLRDPALRGWSPPAIQEKPVKTLRIADKIRERWPDVELGYGDDDPRATVEAMAQRLENSDWDDCKWSDVRRAAEALFVYDFWIDVKFRQLFEMLLALIKSNENLPYIRAAYRLYVSKWSRELEYRELTDRLAEHLTEVLPEVLPSLVAMIEDYAILEPDNVIDHLLVAMNETDEPYRKMKELGFSDPHGPGLMEEMHKAFVEKTRSALAEGDMETAQRMLNWLGPEPRLKLEKGAWRGINALLEPWYDRKREVDLRYRRLVEDKLVKTFGDPRTTQAGQWMACSDEARQTIHRWLTQKTLLAFFDIIDRVEASHMWPDRRAYWTRRFEDGCIDDAWVVLSDRGREVAVQNPEMSLEEHGKNVSTHHNEDNKKCFLILSDSGLLVIEGSHNFKLHIVHPKIRHHVEEYPSEFDGDFARQLKRCYPDYVVDIIHNPHVWQVRATAQIAKWRP